MLEASAGVGQEQTSEPKLLQQNLVSFVPRLLEAHADHELGYTSMK